MKNDLWRRPVAGVVVTALLGVLSQAAQAGPVTPPPLPRGSELVRPMPGMDPVESKRSVRAHHHSGHYKKDYTRDDSLAGGTPGAAGSGPATSGKK